MNNKPVKSINVAKAIIDKANESAYSGITQLKLIKMVYIAHGWMLAVYDVPLISDEVQAWTYGPVLPALYQKIKRFGSNQITDISNKYKCNFSENQLSIINQTYDNYHNLSASQLVTLTHKDGTPWQTIFNREHFATIPNDTTKAYYKNVLNG